MKKVKKADLIDEKIGKNESRDFWKNAIAFLVVLGRVQNSSGSGLHFWQSSGSGLIGFANFSKVRVRVYRVSFLNFGFSGLSGSGLK